MHLTLKWALNQPNNYGKGHNCVEVSNGEWNDDLCQVQKPFGNFRFLTKYKYSVLSIICIYNIAFEITKKIVCAVCETLDPDNRPFPVLGQKNSLQIFQNTKLNLIY